MALVVVVAGFVVVLVVVVAGFVVVLVVVVAGFVVVLAGGPTKTAASTARVAKRMKKYNFMIMASDHLCYLLLLYDLM